MLAVLESLDFLTSCNYDFGCQTFGPLVTAFQKHVKTQ